MQLDVSGHHVDVSPALRSYVRTKFERLERHFDIATHAHVILTVEKLDRKAEATVHVSGGNLFARPSAQASQGKTHRSSPQREGKQARRPGRMTLASAAEP